MDRLSEGSRVAMQAFRQALSPAGERVERNWDAIERRALELDLDGPDDFEELAPGELDEADLAAIAAIERTAATTPAPRRWPIAAAAIALAAAAVAIVTLVPAARTASEQPSTAGDAAAYDADRETPEGRADAVTPIPDASPRRASIELPIPTPVIIVPTTPPEPSIAAPKRPRPIEPARSSVAAPQPDDTEALALREEASLLRRARSALKSGDAAASLAIVAEHTRRFPAGRLAEEIAVLRIAALCDSGRRDAGRAAADAFLAAHPSSPLGARVRGLCSRGLQP